MSSTAFEIYEQLRDSHHTLKNLVNALYALTEESTPFSDTIEDFVKLLEEKPYNYVRWEKVVANTNNRAVQIIHGEYLKESKNFMILVKTKYIQDT